jgi:hypothetical protein
MNEPLSMVIDPRWVVAVPENDDLAAEVSRQLGPAPEGADENAWTSLRDYVAALLDRALADGCVWAGVWMTLDQTGELVLTRAELELATIDDAIDDDDATISVERLHDELVVSHRDDTYVAEIGLIATALGKAVSYRQIVAVDDDALVDAASISWVDGEQIVVLRAFCSAAGWAGVWYPQLEAMGQTLQRDPTGIAALTMVAHVADDEVASIAERAPVP